MVSFHKQFGGSCKRINLIAIAAASPTGETSPEEDITSLLSLQPLGESMP